MEEKIKEILKKHLYPEDYDGSTYGFYVNKTVDACAKELSSLLQPRQEVSEEKVIGMAQNYAEQTESMSRQGRYIGFIDGFKACQQLQASDAVEFGEFLIVYTFLNGDQSIRCIYNEPKTYYNLSDLYSGPFQEYKRKKKEG